MPIIKTEDLTQGALRWAVAKALGHNVTISFGHIVVNDWQKPGSLVRGNPFIPDMNWMQCGPILDHATHNGWKMAIVRGDGGANQDSAGFGWYDGHVGWDDFVFAEGPIVQVAICRCLVRAKLGDTVDVPAELLEG